MLCIGVNKIKIHFDTSQLCCGVVHFIVTSISACLSPDGTILVLLGELNYQVINTWADVCTT
jgi:hypothetical protein